MLEVNRVPRRQRFSSTLFFLTRRTYSFIVSVKNLLVTSSSSIHSSVHQGRNTFFTQTYNMAPTSPVREAHTPRVSSPLSPSQKMEEQPCKIVRRRSRSGRKPNTLCARLLRARAQESWRNHVLSAQVAQYESTTMDQAMKSPEQKPLSPPKSQAVHLNFSLDKNQRFRLGDLSNRMTRRLLLAMGFVGVVPAMSVPRYLPQTMPIMAS